MNTIAALGLAFGIGLINGLRSFTAPAVISWAAHWKWIDLQQSALAFMGSAPAAYILTALAIAELVMDKLPTTPSRTRPMGLIARIVLGGLSGAALAAAANYQVAIGAVLGGLGGVAGTFMGYELRRRLVKGLNVPDFAIALLEDAVAIGGAFFLVTRF
ncbi:MAG: DUF4126 family protein [Blastocatellia bacterium]